MYRAQPKQWYISMKCDVGDRSNDDEGNDSNSGFTAVGVIKTVNAQLTSRIEVRRKNDPNGGCVMATEFLNERHVEAEKRKARPKQCRYNSKR